MSDLNEFELELRRDIFLAIKDDLTPSAVELVMQAVIKIEKRLAELENGKA